MLPALQKESTSVSVRVVSSPHGSALALISQTIDSSGHVDTVRLALWLADTIHSDFARAAQAYSAIEDRLLARSAADVARFNEDLVEALRSEERRASEPGYRKKRLKTNPILARRWEQASNGCVPPGRFTAALPTLLDAHGIHVRRQRLS